jgi:tRNA (guanine37-N1)-methyltransferase
VTRIEVVTLFPGMFPAALEESMLRVARERGAVDIRVVDLRD